ALNEKLRNYITSYEFWANIKCLHKVLEPVKTAVKTVESLKKTNDLSEVNSNILNIKNSVNLEYALINTDQPIILDEAINHSEKDFDIDALTNQGMQMRN
ncbi:10392_t:CDS:2, partial [Racocetra fulgida]